MDSMELARQIEERYRRYLETTFYFRDPDLRASFKMALKSGHLSKGPYLEATPVFRRTQTPRELFHSLLESQPDEGFLRAVLGDRPLYAHQEEAIRKVFQERNVIVATGTGSGKTEAFLYPILLHLYREFTVGEPGPGVRALILYPMNALANDQRERLGEICQRLEKQDSPFRFTFGQYIGETPKDEDDSWRHARDHLARRLPGELVLRSEMRNRPPHILLTNYSMLEYLLLRPDDSPLFDNGRARWWTFLVLDEAHQYRGSRGIEMGMLVRRLKRRLREGGRTEAFRCIATSATLAEGEKDRKAVAQFASDLFGEEFREEDVILGEPEPIPDAGPKSLSREEYRLLRESLKSNPSQVRTKLSEIASHLGLLLPAGEEVSNTVGRILQQDRRSTDLRQSITATPREVQETASEVFSELPDEEWVQALSELVDLLVQARDPTSAEDPKDQAPLLSARYHLFLRSLEGAFVSYWPQKKLFLDRRAQDQEGVIFEIALCRECGQHYFVGAKLPGGFRSGKLREAIRDPGHDRFGATFFRPIEDDKEDEDREFSKKQMLRLCVRCGEIWRTDREHNGSECRHENSILVAKEDAPSDEDRADQLARCGVCGYNAAGHDPVREVVHGTDGPNAVVATTLYQHLPEGRKKVLAFADGRQQAAFFAWYLEDSYRNILSRNLLIRSYFTKGLQYGRLEA
jgi:hypothetical protein